MNYYLIRSELLQYIYNCKELNVHKKQKVMTNLMVGVYKTQIMEYISLQLEMKKIKEDFLNMCRA